MHVDTVTPNELQKQDNVGGPTLDAVLPRMKRGGRIVASGSISQYHVLVRAVGVCGRTAFVTTWDGDKAGCKG